MNSQHVVMFKVGITIGHSPGFEDQSMWVVESGRSILSAEIVFDLVILNTGDDVVVCLTQWTVPLLEILGPGLAKTGVVESFCIKGVPG